MGYLRRPSYYRQFRCIGSDCTDNCCIGWEIDIDPETLAPVPLASGCVILSPFLHRIRRKTHILFWIPQNAVPF